MTITHTIQTITPKDARNLLATSIRNRKIVTTAVNRYRNDMANGRWGFAGDPIRLDNAGHLIDGQHRLTALAQLPDGTAIDFLVIEGLDPETQMAMDQGRLRQAAQQLQMLGVKDANTVAAGVRLYLSYRHGYLFRDNKLGQEHITTAYIESWVAEHDDMVSFLGGFITNIRLTDAPGSVAYAAAIIFANTNPMQATEFFKLLSHGAGGADHPITVLDKRLQRHRREGVRISNRDALGLYVQAWNAWRKGRPLTKFQRPRGGTWTITTFPKVAA